MFRTKLVKSNATTTPKPPKPLRLDNVPINVVVAITIRNQQPKQQVLKEKELIKAKGVNDWQQEHLHDSFIEIVSQLHRGGTYKQPITTNEEPL